MQKKWPMAALAGLVAGSVTGAGFQLYTEGSAEALGQAGAISGRTNLISLAWYNPSALAGTERPRIMAGSAFASIKTDYKSGIDSSFDASMSDDWQAIPHFYYIQPLSGQLTGTLSINAPYGLITEWPDSWGPPDPDTGLPAGSLLATYSELRTIYITPSIAWRPLDGFSVSAGLNVVDAEAQLEGTGRKATGDDISYGGTVSAHYQLLKDWGFGVRYQSRVKLDISGSLELIPPLTPAAVILPASADLTLPSSVNLGLANTTVKNLSLGVDLVWTEWSTYDELAIGGLPASEKNWDDVISLRIGGEYALGESWMFRAGYVWDESPVPDSTRAPELPGSDRQMLTFGAGWNCWKTMRIDAAYSYLWAADAPSGTEVGLPGGYETTTHLLAFSVGCTF